MVQDHSQETLLELTDVSRSYGAGDGTATADVLRGVSLRVRRGESVAIVGPSGSGKSTLLNLIGALDRPSDGTVALDGVELSDRSPDELAAIRNQRIGFVFQAHHLLPQCSALENVLVPTLARGGGRSADAAARARELLARVGLADRVSHRPGQLSGGECQRVAVVRALINQPDLLLADEPTGSLDAESAHDLGTLLAQLNREDGLTLIVVTHSTALAAQMHRVLELRNGRLEPAGDPVA